MLDYQVSELYQAKYYLIHQVLNRDIYRSSILSLGGSWVYEIRLDRTLKIQVDFMTSGSDFCDPYSALYGLPWEFVGKESTCNAGDPSLIPGLESSTGEGIGYPLQDSWASLVAQLVKNLPAMQKTWVRCLGWEDPLEKGKATTPVCWPGEFHGLYSPWGHKELDTTEQLLLHFTLLLLYCYHPSIHT